MKKIRFVEILITASIVLGSYVSANCQDLIYKTDGNEIVAKVIEITNEVIKYRNFEQLDGPIRNIFKTDIFMIIYQDGTKEVFKNLEQTIPKKSEEEIKSTPKTPQLKSDTQSNTSFTTVESDSKLILNFRVNAGYFLPLEDAISEIYGNGLVLGTGLSIFSYNGFGGMISFEYFSKKGSPLTDASVGVEITHASSKIKIIPINLTGEYQLANNKNIIPYFGAGLGISLVNETIDMTYIDPYSGDTESIYEKVSETAIGFHILSGIRFNHLFLELKYTNANIEGGNGAAGENVNIGGVTLSGGLSF